MPCKFNNGEFEVGKKLGDGTYGEIYTATSKKDAKAVVLKVIPFLTDKRKMSFLRESSISRKLHTQRNIIAVDSCYYNDKVGVLVMEKMDCDLLEFIMRKNSLPERLSKLLFRDICKALYQCHSNGISHLDIKPDNILLKIKDPSTSSSSSSSSSEGVKDEEQSNYEVEYVKLADFGFSYDFSTRARKSNGNNNNNLIDFNFEFDQLVGTAQYRAPEAKNAPHSSYLADKVDMWGLGITLFCMITGSFPFADVNGKLVSNDFNLVKKKCKDEKCFDLVTNLLQFNPLDRFDILQTLSHPWLSD